MNDGALERESFAAGELCIVFECHAVVCAAPARLVDRLVLAEEATLLPAASPGSALDGERVVVSAGQRFAAWDLGELLELPPLSTAWMLLRLPHRSASITLALRTGRCRAVERLGHTVSVPRGVFRRRKGAFPAAFARGGLVGVFLDPLALFTSDELETSARTLAATPSTEAARP
jgi:hypothetical protein